MENLTQEIGKNVPIEDVLAEAQDQGIDNTTAAALIDKLKQKGDLYEPKPGHLRSA